MFVRVCLEGSSLVRGALSRMGRLPPSDAGLVPWGTLPSAPKALTFWKFRGVFGNRDEW